MILPKMRDLFMSLKYLERSEKRILFLEKCSPFLLAPVSSGVCSDKRDVLGPGNAP